jgi:hypothetical protein
MTLRDPNGADYDDLASASASAHILAHSLAGQREWEGFEIVVVSESGAEAVRIRVSSDRKRRDA